MSDKEEIVKLKEELEAEKKKNKTSIWKKILVGTVVVVLSSLLIAFIYGVGNFYFNTNEKIETQDVRVTKAIKECDNFKLSVIATDSTNQVFFVHNSNEHRDLTDKIDDLQKSFSSFEKIVLRTNKEIMKEFVKISNLENLTTSEITTPLDSIVLKNSQEIVIDDNYQFEQGENYASGSALD